MADYADDVYLARLIAFGGFRGFTQFEWKRIYSNVRAQAKCRNGGARTLKMTVFDHWACGYYEWLSSERYVALVELRFKCGKTASEAWFGDDIPF